MAIHSPVYWTHKSAFVVNDVSFSFNDGFEINSLNPGIPRVSCQKGPFGRIPSICGWNFKFNSVYNIMISLAWQMSGILYISMQNFMHIQCCWNTVPGRQMRPMNPQGDPRSYHSWSVWRPMDYLGFCRKCFVMKVERRFHRCTDIKCPLCLSKMQHSLVHFDHFLLVAWSTADYWLTTQPSTIGGPLGEPGFCIFCSTAYQGSTLMLVHELLTLLPGTVDGKYVWYGIFKKVLKN